MTWAKCQVERGVPTVSMMIPFPFFHERIMPFPWQENMQQIDRFGLHSVLGHPWRLLKRDWKLWVNIVSLVHNLLLGKEMFDLEPAVVVQCCNYSSFSLRWLYFGAFSRNLLTVRATEQLPAQCAPVSRVRPWPAKELPTIHSFKPIYCLLLVSAACSLWQVIIKDCKDTVPKRS